MQHERCCVKKKGEKKNPVLNSFFSSVPFSHSEVLVQQGKGVFRELLHSWGLHVMEMQVEQQSH